MNRKFALSTVFLTVILAQGCTDLSVKPTTTEDRRASPAETPARVQVRGNDALSPPPVGQSAEPQAPVIVTPESPAVTGTELIRRNFVTNAEIDEFHYVDSMTYAADDPRAAFFDDKLGGARIPIVPGEAMSSLRKDGAWVKAPTRGRVYVQYDFYVPASYYQQPWAQMSWNTMKTFRIFNATKRQTKIDNAGTVTILPAAGDLWLREFGQHEGDENVRLGWTPEPDTWHTFRIVYDYDALKLEFTARVGGRLIVERTVPMAWLPPVDNVAPLLHSTSRSHSASTGNNGEHATFLGFRHVVMGVE